MPLRLATLSWDRRLLRGQRQEGLERFQFRLKVRAKPFYSAFLIYPDGNNVGAGVYRPWKTQPIFSTIASAAWSISESASQIR